MSKAKFGLLGLGVMGQNLALNIERNGYAIAVWNREPEKVETFIREAQDKQILGARSIEELVEQLERPRKIMMMIKAGEPVDWRHHHRWREFPFSRQPEEGKRTGRREAAFRRHGRLRG
jgi:6-phosphogluconate dehydrogenase